MDVFWTVVSGVIVLVVGQWVVRFVIDPIVAFKLSLGEVQHLLLKNRKEILNMENRRDLAESIKFEAAKLIAKRRAVPKYDVWSRLNLLPSREKLDQGFKTLLDLGRMLEDGMGGVGEGVGFLSNLDDAFDLPEITFFKYNID